MKVNIIGGGLAGSEAAHLLSSFGVQVNLYDQKPLLGEAFHTSKFGELVCSNSLKSEDKESASGLLKGEMEIMGSLVLEAANKSRVPSGQDLAVDREAFSSYIDKKIREDKNIHVISEKVTELEEGEDVINIVCTGPLTEKELMGSLKTKLGGDFLSFYDAAAPLVLASSLDTSKMYVKSRYDKGEGKYLNIPLDREQYEKFVYDLKNAKRVILHDFEHFEGCLPVETMADRGFDTLRFGPLKPKGLETEDIHPYAVVQLRRDDAAGDLYGFVGFQTNLTYPEQRRVLSSLPGLENVKFARYGLMHRNSYINAPSVINRDLSLKVDKNTYIAGQLSGVEGYMESASTGLLAGYYVLQRLNGKKFLEVPVYSMIGSLVNYLVMSSPKHFAPMNACYGILQCYSKKHKEEIYNNSMKDISTWVKISSSK